MLRLDRHKIPQRSLKTPMFIVFVVFKKIIKSSFVRLCLFQTDFDEKCTCSPLLKKPIFRKVADNSQETPKHTTLTFAQTNNRPEATMKIGYNHLGPEPNFQIGPEPNFQNG